MQTALMTEAEWALAEFGGAELHDQRRSRRLVQVAGQFAARPHGTLPASFDRWSDTKAAYRLLERPEVGHEGVLAPHRARVRAACQRPGEYLFPEDTTALDFSNFNDTAEYSDLEMKQFVGELGFLFNISESWGVKGATFYYLYDDLAPYLFDTEGKTFNFYLSVIWNF